MPRSLVLNGNGCGMALGICPRQSRSYEKRDRMTQIGRNTPCPCGSGKKYKRCCEPKEADMRQRELPPGRFRYESGSYGGPGRGYMPSILCYQELKADVYTEYFCLVKPDSVFDDEEAAAAMAEHHLAVADAARSEIGSPQEFALALRHEGYKSLSDFRVVTSENR